MRERDFQIQFER
jgi:hypothetical protein